MKTLLTFLSMLLVLSMFGQTVLPAFNSPITLDGSKSSDPDGTISIYKWEQVGTTPMIVTITNSNKAIATITPSSGNWLAGTYTFKLTVTDNDGASSSAITHVNISPNPHLQPNISAGGDKTIQLPTDSLTLTGVATTGDGAHITDYKWSLISGPNTPTFSTPTAISTNISGLIAGVYKIRFRVQDNLNASSADTMTITVKIANKVPVPNAGNDQSISLPVKSVVLGANDNIQPGWSIKWTKVSGGTATILSPFSSTTKVDGLQHGTYLFRKTISNQTGTTMSDDVTVTVRRSFWYFLFGWLINLFK